MDSQRFRAVVADAGKDRLVIPIPFDPDEIWGRKAQHLVNGTVEGRRLRGRIERVDDRWVMILSLLRIREAGVVAGDVVTAELAPEGPQRAALADDIAVALDASPTAGAFFDTLAQFYRKAYLTWIDGTKRRPEVRAERIAEMVRLLEAGVKQRR
jgi:uncharacterized protein YdeI (YjbR/CyaY-like superfamily)